MGRQVGRRVGRRAWVPGHKARVRAGAGAHTWHPAMVYKATRSQCLGGPGGEKGAERIATVRREGALCPISDGGREESILVSARAGPKFELGC